MTSEVSQASPSHSQLTLTANTKALKEWAIVVWALEQGEQILLLRKGGIAEKTEDFTVENKTFYFYPTYEHEKIKNIKPTYQEKFFELHREEPKDLLLTSWGEITDDLVIQDVARLTPLSPFHLWTDVFIAMRAAYKPHIPLHLLLVRVYRLTLPVRLPMQPEYAGCRSWVTLAEDIPAQGSTPALSKEAFQTMRGKILNTLQEK